MDSYKERLVESISHSIECILEPISNKSDLIIPIIKYEISTINLKLPESSYEGGLTVEANRKSLELIMNYRLLVIVDNILKAVLTAKESNKDASDNQSNQESNQEG